MRDEVSVQTHDIVNERYIRKKRITKNYYSTNRLEGIGALHLYYI